MVLLKLYRSVTPYARARIRGVALTFLGLGSMVLAVFLLAGAWGFLALGIGLLALDWSLDSGNSA